MNTFLLLLASVPIYFLPANQFYVETHYDKECNQTYEGKIIEAQTSVWEQKIGTRKVFKKKRTYEIKINEEAQTPQDVLVAFEQSHIMWIESPLQTKINWRKLPLTFCGTMPYSYLYPLKETHCVESRAQACFSGVMSYYLLGMPKNDSPEYKFISNLLK